MQPASDDDDVDASIEAIVDSLERHLSRNPLRNWARVTAIFLARFAQARNNWALLTIGLLDRDALWRRSGLCPGSCKVSL